MVMARDEKLARLALVFILIGVPVIVFGFQLVLRPNLSDTRIIDIHMRIPEAGGFSQDVIQVGTGEALTLRFHADDVTHGIAIGPGLSADLGAIAPGEVGEMTLTFDHAGTYTYYCITYCSPNHWRMRGVIEVRDVNHPNAIPTAWIDPVIANLQTEGVNIDEPRTLFPPLQGMNIVLPDNFEGWTIPQALEEMNWRRTHSPMEASELLAALNPERTPEAVYGVIAALWLDGQSENAVDGKQLYNQNCAACHGQSGLSDGPGAFFTPVQPAPFGNAAYMFTMRSDVLYAKIRRGGMGTNMPNFGTLLTPEETWALVDYLWQLALGEN